MECLVWESGEEVDRGLVSGVVVGQVLPEYGIKRLKSNCVCVCVRVFVCICMSVCVRVCVLMWSRPSIHFIAENEDDLELLVLLLCDGFACVGPQPFLAFCGAGN